ncbi:thiamine pyrophosphate-dependent enzyme [Rheinheimera texasensis]|uniref:thiamine pyrophosphate-dependent enzyme n=1 Tax=Rheinheimera texasensis TaxID=306205 RepID=UPI0004E1E8C2|nr:thiamine pyrophosphate-dependent enzyme [Rheinheimera texasensis]
MILADLLHRRLSDNGIHDLYTIPGDFILPWLGALESGQRQQAKPLRLIQLSHEPSAVYAADAAARWRNAPSAVMLTYGAGALNAVNAIAQAYMEYVPLLVFAGYPSQHEAASGLLLHHQVSDLNAQRRILTEVTCGQCRLDDPATAAQQLTEMIQRAISESKPVLIELPRDMANAQVLCSPLAKMQSGASDDVNQTDLRNAQRQLEQFCLDLPCKVTTPCLLVGVKAKRFGFDLAVAELAQRCGMPALTTLLGRGVLDISAASYKGVYSGAKEDPALPWLQQSDFLICAGVIRSDSNFAAHPRLLTDRPVLWVDEQQTQLPDGRVIKLPALEVLAALQHAFTARAEAKPQVQITAAPCENAFKSASDQNGQTAGVWRSDTLVNRLHQLLSQQSQTYPFVVDIGDCLFAALSANPATLIAPAFYASMGFAVPAALGLQLSSGLRPIVLVGDGAFQMTGLELGHCQRYGLNPIVIVLNNQSWGMIKAFAPELTAAGLAGWQYAALGRAMGCGASQIWNLHQFDGALADALADTRRPRLIEVMLPQHGYSETLASFQRGLCSSA